MNVSQTIRDELHFQRRTLGWLAQEIYMSRQNLYVKMKQNDMKSSEIKVIAKALEVEYRDFVLSSIDNETSEDKPDC